LRSEPRLSDPASANVIAELPDGQRVRAVSETRTRGFLEVETDLDGALLRGFVFATYLVAEPAAAVIQVPAIEEPGRPLIMAVDLPRMAGSVTRRKDVADAHSLNEAGQPGRHGTTGQSRREELLQIIRWLAVDNPAHKRYQPRAGATFCNIYCHDVCHLAGAYLPRTWWSAPAIAQLSGGRVVDPLIENTVYEMRANGLFHWLREFGPGFGWRRIADLDSLQQAADGGGVALIVARRTENGKPGHIVAVVPESDSHRARRNRQGELSSPLQSQAGSRNFQFGTGSPGWWKRGQFADFAYWLHP
jgi:hypothetical protein